MTITTSPPEDYDSAVQCNVGLGELFLLQARQSPDAVAVVDGDSTLTYGELHSRACTLASELSEHHAMPAETPVGILVHHGIADVVAQLAAIYVGASCVPLDPNLPDELVVRRMQRLNAKNILVDEENCNRDLPFHRVSVKLGMGEKTDENKKDSLDEQRNRFPVHTDLAHRSHVMHTSGTTSEPKAVAIASRSIVHAVLHAPFEPLRRDDVVAHVNNSSFDVSLFDIWGPLLRGARIAVLHKMVLLDLPRMERHIADLGVTVMATTTALLNLAATVCPRVFAGLRICFIGGEAANVTSVGKILEEGPPGMLINAYGPTECCVWSLARHVRPEDMGKGSVSIGGSIGRAALLITDGTGRAVDEGELWIGGPGVSPGYIDDPKRNAAAFVTVKVPSGSDQVPVRFYRTGDIVRRREDGQFEFIGRVDHQVKIRGFRVDLAAVESALIQTGLFAEAVALHIREIQKGAGSVLVAYVKPRESRNAPEMVQAKQLLSRTLPDYMIPQHLEIISQYPLNSHAKIDRKTLTDWFCERWQAGGARDCLDSVKSNTRTVLRDLWARLLPLPAEYDYQDTDDFFQLGGTSMQASLLIGQIRSALGVDISLLALYDHSTLASLTELADQSSNIKACEAIRDESNIWLADARLADGLTIPAQPPVDWLGNLEGRVFLTGATGFVGAFMLAELLQMTKVHQVACLVRASDSAAGMQRIQATMESYGLWQPELQDKLVALTGCLEDEFLGPGVHSWQYVASWASIIIHLGAWVNYTQPYSLHRPANIIGTLNIMRLAFTGRVKAVHYASSISCFGPTGYITGARVVNENEPLLAHLKALPYDHGYAQSQWVVEQLLRSLMDRGAPIAIYRPGFITGHSQTGVCNPDDFFSRLVQSCREMKSYPLLPNQRKEFVPVDYVNTTMLHIASKSSSLGRAYHLVPPTPSDSVDMNQALELVSRASGCAMRGLPYADWAAQLLKHTPERLQPLQPMLVERVRDGLTRWELYENMPTYATANVKAALADYAGPSGRIEFPVLGEALMKKYVDYLASRSVVQ
ncbi:acetyl-CoA synthetase-like protein [Aspergillus filifer]